MRSITIKTIDLSIKHIKVKRKCSEVPPILKRAFIYIKRNNFKSFRCIQSFQTSGRTLQRVSTAKAIKNTPFRNSPRGWVSGVVRAPLFLSVHPFRWWCKTIALGLEQTDIELYIANFNWSNRAFECKVKR